MRHSALIPLSHDHHEALLITLRLKKGGPASPNDRLWPKELDKQIHTLKLFFERELLPHFQLEEEILFPAASGLEELTSTISDLLSQHTEMRMMMKAISETSDEELLRMKMKDFGALLESHVRLEERVLFPKLEEAEKDGKIQLPEIQK